MAREFTGRMALMTFGGFFVVIIGVNVAMSYFAINTFPGLEVHNTYVASQQFNGRLKQQLELGWNSNLRYDGKVLKLELFDRNGQPAPVDKIFATIGRATTDRFDKKLALKSDGKVFSQKIDLPPGKWEVRFVAMAADGTEFHQRKHVIVKP